MSESGNGGKQLGATMEREAGQEEEVIVTPSGHQRSFQFYPLDFAVLEKLPEKGLIGGVHWKGRRVKDLADQFSDEVGDEVGKISSGSLASRLKELKKEGYVTDLPSTQGAKIWARTPEGTAFLAKKEEYLGQS